MIEYRYEELISEEKQFLQYVEDDPFLTTETIFPGKGQYAVNMMTHGKRNKLVRNLLIFLLIGIPLTVFLEKQTIFSLSVYFLCIVFGCIFLFSVINLGKLKFEKGSLLVQKEVHLLNVHACERVLLRNREPVEYQVLKETSTHIKVQFKETVPSKQRRFSFLKRTKTQFRKKDIVRIVSMNGYYYMFMRWNYSLIWHIRLTEQEFQKIRSERIQSSIEKYGTTEITEASYKSFVEESKEDPVHLKAYTKYLLIYFYSIFPFLILGLTITFVLF